MFSFNKVNSGGFIYNWSGPFPDEIYKDKIYKEVELADEMFEWEVIVKETNKE